MPHDATHTWELNYGTNGLTSATERDSQTETKVVAAEGDGVWGSMD